MLPSEAQRDTRTVFDLWSRRNSCSSSNSFVTLFYCFTNLKSVTAAVVEFPNSDYASGLNRAERSCRTPSVIISEPEACRHEFGKEQVGFVFISSPCWVDPAAQSPGQVKNWITHRDTEFTCATCWVSVRNTVARRALVGYWCHMSSEISADYLWGW